MGWLVGLLAALVLAVPAIAADLKVGVVDMQKILQVAPQVLQVREQLRKEFAPQQKEILDKQRRLQALEEKFTKTGTVMNDDERETTQSEITQLQHEIQQSRNDFLDDLNLRRNEELGKLQRLVLKEVNDYAGENHFDLIVGDGVFYASKRVDVTDAIIQRLKQDFKKNGAGEQEK
jgi:outer membrane protein